MQSSSTTIVVTYPYYTSLTRTRLYCGLRGRFFFAVWRRLKLPAYALNEQCSRYRKIFRYRTCSLFCVLSFSIAAHTIRLQNNSVRAKHVGQGYGLLRLRESGEPLFLVWQIIYFFGWGRSISFRTRILVRKIS